MNYLNDDHHAAFMHSSNCISHHTGLVYVVEIFKISYGMSWKSRRRSWMRKEEAVGQYYSKTSERSTCHQLLAGSMGI